MQINLKYKYLCTVMLIFFISGCSTEQILQPKDKAQQLDLRAAFAANIAKKYDHDGLTSVMAAYDNLLRNKEETEARLRLQDEAKRADLTDKIYNATKEISDKKKRLDLANASNANDKLQLIAIEKQKADLERKPLDAVTSGKIAQLSKSIDEYNTQIGMFPAVQGQLNDDLEATKTMRQDFIDQAMALKNKTYPDIENRRKQIRSEVINDFLALADSNYLAFKDTLLSGRARSDTALDITELIFSTATTLVGGVTAKTNLGASSTLLKGSRSTVDKNFFAQQTISSILNAIEDQQQKDKTIILKGLTQSTEDYPLTQALSDVQLYESRASLVAGVLLVTNQTALTAKDSKQNLDTFKQEQK